MVELLGVITVLGVLMLIAVPQITNLINDSKEESYKRQIEYIEGAARDYMAKNSLQLPDAVENSSTCVSITTLKTSGFLKNSNIVDSRNNTNITGSVIITYENNKYVYAYSESACS